MPSRPRPRGTARRVKGQAPDPSLGAPEGAVVAEPPAKGLWLALVDEQGHQVTQDGKPVRLP